MVRIEPVQPPYPAEVGDQLARMMPPGVPPIGLFRTFVRNLPMARAMSGWGTYELGRDLSLSLRDREILIDRTCARCGCDYELGVHVAFFAEKAGFSDEQVESLARGSSADPCWTQERDRLLIDLADALHLTSTVPDELWARLGRSPRRRRAARRVPALRLVPRDQLRRERRRGGTGGRRPSPAGGFATTVTG